MAELFKFSFPNFSEDQENKKIILEVDSENQYESEEEEFELKLSEDSDKELTSKIVSHLLSSVQRDLSAVIRK